MKEKAEADGVDLLLIDSGDRIEGGGLSDASDPKGKYIREIFPYQEIDVISSGNHEYGKRLLELLTCSVNVCTGCIKQIHRMTSI